MALSPPIPLTELMLLSESRLKELAIDERKFKHGAAVLARKADFAGWSEERLTAALKIWGRAGEMVLGGITVVPVDSRKSLKTSDPERETRLQKRQETVRITRQADVEGWSDEKLVAALRLRHEIHHELRHRVTCI